MRFSPQREPRCRIRIQQVLPLLGSPSMNREPRDPSRRPRDCGPGLRGCPLLSSFLSPPQPSALSPGGAVLPLRGSQAASATQRPCCPGTAIPHPTAQHHAGLARSPTARPLCPSECPAVDPSAPAAAQPRWPMRRRAPGTADLSAPTQLRVPTT